MSIDQPSVIVGVNAAPIAELRDRKPEPGHGLVPVIVIEPDAAMVATNINGLPGVHAFVGTDCVEQFEAYLQDSPDSPPPARVLGEQRVAHCAKRVVAVLEKQTASFNELAAKLRGELDRRTAGRGPSYYVDRLALLSGRDGPVCGRVLLITSRHSTYLKHSVSDLAECFESGGIDTRVLLEPDETGTVSIVRVLKAIEEHDPDLIVVPNVPRAKCYNAVPSGIPYVCWVQDGMPMHFEAIEPDHAEFLAGHVLAGAPGISAYPEHARLSFPVPIHAAKFEHVRSKPEADGPDIAYVSHQSEHAEALRDQLFGNASPAARRVVDECFEQIASIIGRWQDGYIIDDFREPAERLARHSHGPNPPEVVINALRTTVVDRIAERMIRHETLGWAASIAERNGLSLALYGNGWEKHPALSRYAAGPLEHDESLAACYRNAGVHLHASIRGVWHQRVAECAMAGGLPLCRRSWIENYNENWMRAALFLQSGIEPDATLVKWRWPAYVIENHPELQAILEERDHMPEYPLPWDHDYFEGVYAQVDGDESVRYYKAPVPPERARPLSILGGPYELTFSTEADLEERVLRAIRDREWRRSCSDGVAARSKRLVSMERFAGDLIDLAARGMERAAGGSASRDAKAREPVRASV